MKFVKSNTLEMQRKCKINKVKVKLYDKWEKKIFETMKMKFPHKMDEKSKWKIGARTTHYCF